MIDQQLEHIPTENLIRIQRDISAILARRKKANRMDRRLDFVSSLQPIEESSEDAFAKNSASILSIPNHWGRKFQSNAQFLPALFAQDWSHLYNRGDTEPRYYVYAHVDPTKAVFCAPKKAGGNYGGTPFYIGKGTGERAWDLKRNQGHGKRLRQLLDAGYDSTKIVHIVVDGLTECKALEIEAKLIYYFGTIYNQSVKKRGVLLNLDTPAIPEFVGVMAQ